MSLPTMVLGYLETKTVTFQPKTASGASKVPASTNYSFVNGNLLEVTPDLVIPYTFAIKSLYNGNGGAQMSFNAVNSVADGGAVINDQMSITLVAADPITQVTHVIS